MQNNMTDQDKKQLWIEIEHIFDSGANEIRVFNMVESFIEKRYLIPKQQKQPYCPKCSDFGTLHNQDGTISTCTCHY